MQAICAGFAADLAEEHGEAARDYARRAVVSFESEGEPDRALFWFTLSVFLDDIILQRIDPQAADHDSLISKL